MKKKTLKLEIEGIKGQDGYTPVKGQDYFTDKEIKSFKKDITPKKGKDYFTEKDIKDIADEIKVPLPKPEKVTRIIEKVAQKVDLSEYTKEDKVSSLLKEQSNFLLSKIASKSYFLNDLVDVNVDNVSDKQVLTYDFETGTWIPGSGAGLIQWGEIEGNIEDQTDLISYLDDNYTPFFPEHLDGGNIADTPADIVEPTISFDGGNQNDNLTANWKFITGTISDNTALQAELDAKQDNITVSDTAEIDMTLSGVDISASIVASSIDETKLDASVNASLDLADSASQPGHTHTASDVTDFDTEVSNNTDVAANTTHRTSNGTDHTFIDQDVTTTASPTFTGITNDGDEHEQINTLAWTSNHTVGSGERNLLCDTSGGAFTLTLPATPTAGRVVSVILDVAGNDLTIDGNGKNINGEATKLLGTVGGVNFIYNGTQWNIK